MQGEITHNKEYQRANSNLTRKRKGPFLNLEGHQNQQASLDKQDLQSLSIKDQTKMIKMLTRLEATQTRCSKKDRLTVFKVNKI